MMMSVPQFLDNFIMEEMPIEVHLFKESGKKENYVGSPANFDCFCKSMEDYQNTEVFSVYVNKGKLILCASEIRTVDMSS